MTRQITAYKQQLKASSNEATHPEGHGEFSRTVVRWKAEVVAVSQGRRRAEGLATDAALAAAFQTIRSEREKVQLEEGDDEADVDYIFELPLQLAVNRRLQTRDACTTREIAAGGDTYLRQEKSTRCRVRRTLRRLRRLNRGAHTGTCRSVPAPLPLTP